jgi:hypothetical protein
MRTIALTSITLATLSVSTIGARADESWCANHDNCGFYSFQQCMASISGNGGFCQRNPFSTDRTASESRRRNQRDK